MRASTLCIVAGLQVGTGAPLLPPPPPAATDPSSLAAERLRDMLNRAHHDRDAARLVARKLSVESALLPAFIVQDLAHGCASRDLAASLAYGFGAAASVGDGSGRAPGAPPTLGTHAVEPGWTCPPGMAWRVRATTERLCSAGPEPAVAIDWIIESDGMATWAFAAAFEPSLMPAELDFPLLPWGLELRWDATAGHAIDQSGRSHSERWLHDAPILANPDDMVDAFDAIRVHQWLAPRMVSMPDPIAAGATPAWSGQPRAVESIHLDRGPLAWHDPTAFTLVRHAPDGDRQESFRPCRLIPNVHGLRAVMEWRAWAPSDASPPIGSPSRAPRRIVLMGDGVEQAIITFGSFELVQRGLHARVEVDPPWSGVRELLDRHDAPGLHHLVLSAQDGLGLVSSRHRMGIELALQALDAAVEAGWSLGDLRTMAADVLHRCLDRMRPAELVQLVLDAVRANRGVLALLAAEQLSMHRLAGADERAWASMAMPSLWAWLHDPPADDSPMAHRRLVADRALRPILIGERDGVLASTGGRP
jgi:hypothetical protein